MDETTGSEQPSKPENVFNWHISREELLGMTEEERAVYLNEKTSRLYEAVTMMSRAGGEVIRQEDVELVLNPEEVEGRHQGPSDIGDR